MGKLYLYAAWAIVLCLSCQTSATVLTFEELNYRQDISGDYYYDLYWEFGNPGDSSIIGSWMSPDPSDSKYNYYNFPHSGAHNLINSWGCTEIGFQFPTNKFEYGAIVAGAYFAVQGFIDKWGNSIQAKGYKDDVLIWATEPLILTETPQWLAMSEEPVDRVVIFTTPKAGNNYGWFGMDNLAFDEAPVPEPVTLLLLTLGAALIRRRK
jgi:hypothetical protein